MRRIAPVLAGSLLTLCAVAAGAQVPPGLAGAPGAAAQADKLSPSLDAFIWAGFSFAKTPVFVFDPGAKAGLLFHVTPLPSGFSPTDPAYGGAGLGAIPAGDAPKAGAAPLADRMCAWAPADQMADGPAALQALYSSAFSVFEAYRGFNEPVLPAGAAYPVLDAEGAALVRAEGRVLQRASWAPTTEVPSLLAAFFSLRAQRASHLPPTLMTYEWGRELTDGLSAYAGYLARAKVDPQGAQAALQAALEAVAKEGVGTGGGRFAAIGCAEALALDRSYPAWKEALEKSSRDSLQPMLVVAAGKAAPADMAFVGLAQIRGEEQAAADRAKAEQEQKLNQILKASGLVVVLDLQDALGHTEIKWTNRFQPNGIVRLDGQREIRTNFYSLIGPGVLDFASSRPILIETRKSITSGFDASEVPYISVDGKPVTLSPGETLTGNLEVRGNHLTIKVTQGRLSYSPKLLTVVPMLAGAAQASPPSPAPTAAG